MVLSGSCEGLKYLVYRTGKVMQNGGNLLRWDLKFLCVHIARAKRELKIAHINAFLKYHHADSADLERLSNYVEFLV